MSLFVSFFVAVLALLASLFIYRQQRNDIYLRLFPPFLLVVAVCYWFISYLAQRRLNNLAIFNPLTIFQISFFFFVLYRLIQHKVVKKIAFYLIWIYPIVAGLNILYFQKIETFHSITYSLGGLLIAALCIFYFFELFQRSQSINLMRSPDFWICSGLLFYFACSFPIYGMANTLEKFPQFILTNLNKIFNVLDILLYTSFTIAFLCRLKIRKSL